MKKYLLLILLLLPLTANAEILNTIIEVPDSLVIDNTWISENQGAAYELSRIAAEWPPAVMPGTQAVDGRKLIMAKIEDDSDDPVTLVSTLLVVYGLDWQVIAMQTFYDQEPYCSDSQYIDQQSCETNAGTWTPAQAKTSLPFDLAIYGKYIVPRYNYDCSTDPCIVIGEQIKQCNWLSVWAGGAEWICK